MKTARQIAELLAKDVERVAAHLLPNGKRDGHEWRVGSVEGEAGGSLGVHLSGAKAGVWCDFATGASGDMLSLWALVRHIDIVEALKEASRWVGSAPVKFALKTPKKWVRPDVVGSPLSESMSPVSEYLILERKLLRETIENFCIKEYKHDGKWEIVLPFYRNQELILTKHLGIDRNKNNAGKDKKTIRVSKDCEPILFGWQALRDPNCRTIAITEGEIDAMTLHQYGIAAVSIPFGVNNDKWIEHDYERLAVFDEIFICMDNDEAGNKAALTFAERLGTYRCRLVKLPHKDANECLIAGMTAKEMQVYFDNAEYLDPSEIKGFETYTQAVIDKFYSNEEEKGYSSFSEKAKGKVLFRPGELSIWCGINGHGKSQFLGQLTLDFMKQDAKVCVASLEMPPAILLWRTARQAAGMEKPSPEYIKAIHEWYAGKGWLFELLGTAKKEKLFETFLYVKQRYNVDVFIIDSLLKCGIAEDDYNGQKAFVEELCDFKNQHNVHVHLVVHPRKGDDELTPPNKMNVKGTGAITDLADNVFTIWRNKRKERALDKCIAEGFTATPEIENDYDALWICEKQRNGSWEKAISLWFDQKSLQYLNHKDQKPKFYVPFSNLVERN